MFVVILQLLVVLYTALMILREVISLNCTKVIVLLMSPNTILLTELSMYGTIFQTLLSRLPACYHFVISWLNLIWAVFVLIFDFFFYIFSFALSLSIVLTVYGRPLSVSGRPCYILPMFIFIFIFLWPPYSPALVNGGSRKFYTW